MMASATPTSASSAAISLSRSGVRRGSARIAASARRDPDDGPGPGAGPADITSPLGRGEPEYVANTAQGVQEVWLGGVDLAAQDRDVGLDDARIAAEVVVPDMVQDLHLGEHPAGVAHEIPEQLELSGGELNLGPAAPYLVAVLVELQVGEGEPGRRLGRAAAGPPEHRLDPRDDLLQAERLGDVVVPAERQTADLVLGRIACGEEHHRGAGPAAAQSVQHLESVHIGKHPAHA